MTAHDPTKPATKPKDPLTCSLCGRARASTRHRLSRCGACRGTYRGKSCDDCVVAFESQDFCALAEDAGSTMRFSPGPATVNTAAFLAADA